MGSAINKPVVPDIEYKSDFEEFWPIFNPELSDFGVELLKECQNIETPSPLSLPNIINNSNEFSVKFPINSCRIYNQPKSRRDIIEQQAASAYPLVHERVILLYLRFLEHKVRYGSEIEKKIYTGMSLPTLIDRLLLKRCATFVGQLDGFLLLNGEEGVGGFEEIGTNKEKHPRILTNCLSYDEMKLSAFLSISSHSEFLNDGSRINAGKIESDRQSLEPSGVIIGIIGPRLHRRNVMEFQDIIISNDQNVVKNGYGLKRSTNASNNEMNKKLDYRQIWNEFYDENGILFDQVHKDGKRFTDCFYKNEIIDNLVLKKRYTISFDTLLLESEARASVAGRRGYVHVIGIGLGAWRTSHDQEKIFLETFSQRINVLLPKLNHISFVHFSWFNLTECGDIKDGSCFKSNDHPDGGIRVFVSKRNPAEKLDGKEFNNILLIVSYAWDSNALPGNEFWMGSLTTSGDPAAACSTLITELHNGHINKTMISGDNLHVASPDYGVIHIADYAKQKIKQINF